MDLDWSIKATDLAIIFATLLGPILAVQAQGFTDERRDAKRRRMEIFHTLMRTRALTLSPTHVQALNDVPLEFAGKPYAAVRTAWKVYLNHMGNDTSHANWGARRVELLVSLLQTMGKALNYSFDAVQLEKDVYQPLAHNQHEEDMHAIRKGVAALFRDSHPLPLAVEKMPTDPEMAAAWKLTLERLNKYLDSRTPQA